MKNELSVSEQLVLEIFQNEIYKHGKKQYHQALLDVSSILTWLTCKPPLSMNQLARYVIESFKKASLNCDPDSTIKEQIKFYENILIKGNNENKKLARK